MVSNCQSRRLTVTRHDHAENFEEWRTSWAYLMEASWSLLSFLVRSRFEFLLVLDFLLLFSEEFVVQKNWTDKVMLQNWLVLKQDQVRPTCSTKLRPRWEWSTRRLPLNLFSSTWERRGFGGRWSRIEGSELAQLPLPIFGMGPPTEGLMSNWEAHPHRFLLNEWRFPYALRTASSYKECLLARDFLFISDS